LTAEHCTTDIVGRNASTKSSALRRSAPQFKRNSNDHCEHVPPDAVRPVELRAVQQCTGSTAAGVSGRSRARCCSDTVTERGSTDDVSGRIWYLACWRHYMGTVTWNVVTIWCLSLRNT